MQKPDLVIFSSRQQVPVAEAVRENLKHEFDVTPWTEGLFRSNEIPLNTFIKKLLCFDAAVVILGADDLKVDQDAGGRTIHVPRDNVVFELGACMSRLGTQKTFLLCPEEPEVRLPGYFKGIDPLKYEARADGNLVAAVGSACVQIRRQFFGLDQFAYYSDLPAVGLAYGYFFNFVKPTWNRLKNGRPLKLKSPWSARDGFSLSIVMPDRFMDRNEVDERFRALGLEQIALKLQDGRSICVYAAPRSSPGEPIRVYDIPTTLITSDNVIGRIDSFWGGADRAFREALQRREIASFRRSIEERIRENHLGATVRTIDQSELGSATA